jgi:hypothetical protein
MDTSVPGDDETAKGTRNGLQTAYLNTAYLVPGLRLDIRIGRAHPLLDAYLVQHGQEEWAYISACNPGSHLMTEKENAIRTGYLQRLASAWDCWPGRGESLDKSWPPEASFLVTGIPINRALQLGRVFGQMAIVAGRRGNVALLYWC